MTPRRTLAALACLVALTALVVVGGIIGDHLTPFVPWLFVAVAVYAVVVLFRTEGRP
jgi:hypothetical protein